MLVRTGHTTDYGTKECLGVGLWLWCPGCNSAHRPVARCEEHGGPTNSPTWDWNGKTDETFTISPSLLCYQSYHPCGRDAHPGEACPHTPWGNCHSFIRNGMWEFLGDSAHPLAGQTVPMVDLPAWLAKEDY